MSKLIALCCVLNTVNLLTCPLNSIYRRILVKTFPPNCVVIKIESNIGENCALLCSCKSVRVCLIASARCYAEETVFRVDCIKASVRTFSDPRNIVAYAPNFVALLLISFRRNKHCKVCFAACRRECCANIFNIAVWSLKTEDEHMLCLPALVFTEI